MLMGFFGVQLFFIASAVTLLMSWSRSDQSFGLKNCRFFIHRFFRIAPLYFLAIAFYWVVDNTTRADFDVERLISTLLFVNTWSPHLLPTTGGWKPVPGGWSISVEFCFYFVFPILALAVTNMRRALLFVAVAYVIMLATAVYGQTLYAEITAVERSNFLYFWFPNQLIVFAIGFLLYRCLASQTICDFVARSRISTPIASAFMLAATFALSYIGLEKEGIAPTHLLMSVCFAAWSLVMLLKPDRLIVNRFITAIGKVSFSIYIVHFALLKLVSYGMEALWPFGKEGVLSLPYTMFLLAIALGMSYAISVITYRTIEQPLVQLGKRLAENLPAKLFSARQSGIG